MARPKEPLPHDNDLRCEGCAYSLGGLPFKGRCPECGTGYAFEYLYRRNALSLERCESCDYALKGLPLRGACPECGEDYWFDRPKRLRPQPGFRDWVAAALRKIRVPSFPVAITLMILGVLAILVWIAVLAMRNFDRAIHVQPGY